VKTLEQSEMIAIVDGIDSRNMSKVLEAMQPLTPKGSPANWLKYGLTEGWYKASTVLLDKVPSLIIYYYVSPDGGLCCNAVASLVSKDVSKALVTAVTILGRNLKCKYVSFQTVRKGMIEKSKRFGFFVESVNLRKIL
jgi:hypothetical protein